MKIYHAALRWFMGVFFACVASSGWAPASAVPLNCSSNVPVEKLICSNNELTDLDAKATAAIQQAFGWLTAIPGGPSDVSIDRKILADRCDVHDGLSFAAEALAKACIGRSMKETIVMVRMMDEAARAGEKKLSRRSMCFRSCFVVSGQIQYACAPAKSLSAETCKVNDAGDELRCLKGCSEDNSRN